MIESDGGKLPTLDPGLGIYPNHPNLTISNCTPSSCIAKSSCSRKYKLLTDRQSELRAMSETNSPKQNFIQLRKLMFQAQVEDRGTGRLGWVGLVHKREAKVGDYLPKRPPTKLAAGWATSPPTKPAVPVSKIVQCKQIITNNPTKINTIIVLVAMTLLGKPS